MLRNYKKVASFIRNFCGTHFNASILNFIYYICVCVCNILVFYARCYVYMQICRQGKHFSQANKFIRVGYFFGTQLFTIFFFLYYNIIIDLFFYF